MYHLRLCKGISYSGVVSATMKEPDVFTKDKNIAEEAVKTGYFNLLEVKEENNSPKPVAKMNTAELEALAKENDIDISACKNNDERKTVIAAALEGKKDENNNDNTSGAGLGFEVDE